ncbi:MAG: hypothetical protein QM743_07535 [Chitinophagaceae bacterium]
MKILRKAGLSLLFFTMHQAHAQFPAIPFSPEAARTAKTTAGGERLIARTKLDYYSGTGYTFTDSATMEWNWTNSSKSEYLPAPLISYDRASVLTYYQNSGGSALPSLKAVNYFDGDGKIYATYRFRWNSSGSKWDTASRTSMTYSGAQLTDSTLELYYASKWIGRQKTSYTYTGVHIASATIQTSTGVTTTWVNTSRILYTWDASDLLIQTQNERSGPTTGSWTKQYLTDISYTGTDSTLSITKIWNTSLGSWINALRRGYKASTVGPYADDSTYRWNTGTGL